MLVSFNVRLKRTEQRGGDVVLSRRETNMVPVEQPRGCKAEEEAPSSGAFERLH